MRRMIIIPAIFLIVALLSGSIGTAEPFGRVGLDAGLQEAVRNRMESAGVPPRIRIGGDMIFASSAMPSFYESRVFHPAWIDQNGGGRQIEAMLGAIRAAKDDGLNPDDYHLQALERLTAEIKSMPRSQWDRQVATLVDMELLLTDAFLILGSHLLKGRVDPESIDPEWFTEMREINMVTYLGEALQSQAVADYLKRLRPRHPGYERLRSSLAVYRRLAESGGWPTIPIGPTLHPGDSDSRIVSVRRRLAATGDADTLTASGGDEFDSTLVAAVKRFQTRHGLEADGNIGRLTLAAMNVSAAERVRQIAVNLERWRWLPQELGQRYLIVNIADFLLEIIDGKTTVMDMRVIVGRPYRRTPVFSDKMTYLVFSPYWHIPRSLAVQDFLPQMKKNPGFLAEQHIFVLKGENGKGAAIDPTSINWADITADNFNFRLRQEPGPLNALGGVKFMFPNKFNVYLHDTPARGLFAKTSRGFSSGCIRIEKPVDLAVYLLNDSGRWPVDSIKTAMKAGYERTVQLPEAIPIHLLYWTAWGDADGILQFRDDIYTRDSALGFALHEKPPAR